MIVVDASALFAALDESESKHEQVVTALASARQPPVLSPFVLAELDHFLVRHLGVATELAFLAEVGRGSYELAAFDAEAVSHAHDVIDRYRDLRIGIADASIVVLAERYATDRVLTLDERHFRALRTLDGRPFTLLPADS
ncbi:MAG: PIN domain-containing protein [Actinobacteria bacterium]|nr:PIN domain-containing protein [Actinomycetota bacterium]